jgi:outer membrane protein
MKKLIILILILNFRLFGQVTKLTLSESLEIGLKNSNDLKLSRSKLTTAEAQVTSATSQLLPQLTFNAGYTRLSSIPPFEVSLPIPGFTKSFVISPIILDNYSLKFSMQQPLFTGLRLWSIRSSAKYNYNAAKSEYQSSVNDAALKIQTAFWNYYKAKLNDSVLTENMQQIKQHLDDTKNFFDNGLATRNDLLKLEVQYSNTNLQRIEAENNLDIARAAFNQSIGLPLDTPTEIVVEKIIVTETVETDNYKTDLTGLLEEAKVNRKELDALKSRIKASDESINAAGSGWFPSIYLFGDYYYSKPNSRYLPAINEFKNTWDAGITLQWNLWNWWYTSSQVTISEQNKIQVETSLAQLNDAVEIEVYQNYLTYKRASEKVNVADLGIKQAEENYRIIQDKYNTQVASSTDLIDAEASLLLAKTNFVNSLVDYKLAKVRLDKAMGRKIY